MSDVAGLLSLARRLSRASPRRPRQADLTRAISTAYYALFHAVAWSNADQLVGTGPRRGSASWAKAYRSLDHGAAKAACQNLPAPAFPHGISTVAQAFVSLQEARHKADYDPHFHASRRDAEAAVAQAEAAIDELRQSIPQDRADFAIHLLMRKPRGSQTSSRDAVAPPYPSARSPEPHR